MKITGIKTRIVAVPFKQFASESKLRSETKTTIGVLTEVMTDEGLVGLGEGAPPLGAAHTKNLIDAAAPQLIGENPLHVNRIMKMVYARFNLTHLHIHAANWALNGIEMALWDLSARAANRPLCELWGGPFRNKIKFFGYIERQEPEAMKAEAAKLVGMGFDTLYVKVGLGEVSDIEAVRAIREGASSRNVRIRVDANQAWTPDEAIRIINAMTEFDLEFVDQPTLMYNLDAMERIRRSVSVPIAAHESGWTMYEMLNIVKRQAADVIHVDPRFDAGFTGARISAGIAEAAGIPVVLHSYGELGVAFAGCLHLAASCPNFSLANQGTSYRLLTDDIIKGGPLQFDVNKMAVPSGIGIGVQLDEDKVAVYEEYYQREVCVDGREKQLLTDAYAGMYFRPFFRDWGDEHK